MRRFLTVALLGLAVTAAASDASAQGRRGGGRRGGGVMDTARARVLDSVRTARGDTAFRRRGSDSLRARRIDSVRAAGVAGAEGRGGRGAGGRDIGPMGGRGGLMGIQLNDNEKAAVKEINAKYRAEIEEFREANKGKARGQNAQLDAQMKAIADRQEAEIRAALTAPHQAEFDANIAKRKKIEAQGGGRRGRRPPPTQGR
jgi:hypothetical protein